MSVTIQIAGQPSYREWVAAGYPGAVSFALCMVPDCLVVLSTSNDEWPREIMCRRHSRSCRYLPNLSFGRYNAPANGCGEYEYDWAVWSREDAKNAPSHLAPRERGWRGLPSETYALRLLQNEPWQDVRASLEAAGLELAARFTR